MFWDHSLRVVRYSTLSHLKTCPSIIIVDHSADFDGIVPKIAESSRIVVGIFVLFVCFVPQISREKRENFVNVLWVWMDEHLWSQHSSIAWIWLFTLWWWRNWICLLFRWTSPICRSGWGLIRFSVRWLSPFWFSPIGWGQSGCRTLNYLEFK